MTKNSVRNLKASLGILLLTAGLLIGCADVRYAPVEVSVSEESAASEISGQEASNVEETEEKASKEETETAVS